MDREAALYSSFHVPSRNNLYINLNCIDDLTPPQRLCSLKRYGGVFVMSCPDRGCLILNSVLEYK